MSFISELSRYTETSSLPHAQRIYMIGSIGSWIIYDIQDWDFALTAKQTDDLRDELSV